jgi:hypothetical protein
MDLVFLIGIGIKQCVNLYTAMAMPHKKQETELNVKLKKKRINEILTWHQFPLLVPVNIER